MHERLEEKYGAGDDKPLYYEGDPEACVGLCHYYRSRGLPDPFEQREAPHQGTIFCHKNGPVILLDN